MQPPREKLVPMAGDLVSQFFDRLTDVGHVATFERESATIRFDIMDAEEGEQPLQADKADRWYVAVADGTVSVTRQDRAADAIVRVGRPQFEAIVSGQLNAQAAFLRGVLTVEGKVGALVMFQRCLPGPPGSTGRVAPIAAKTVMAQRRDT